MAKRKLELDQLAVESFATDAAPTQRGTVNARDYTPGATCEPQDTWYQSCGWSEIDCYTEGCRTDWETCGAFGSCCPAICW